jgi:hypothetical protein
MVAGGQAGRQAGGGQSSSLGEGERQRNKRRVVVLDRAHAVNAANAARQLVPLQATGLFPRAPSPGNRLTTPRHMHWASTTPHAAACTRSSLPGPSPPLPNVLSILDARAAIPLGRQIAA